MLLENENMGNYEFEKKVLNSDYNKASFYIPGKEIIIDENSNIKFHPIDDIDDFNYSQDIEEEYLFDEYQLTVDEKNAVHKLISINNDIAKNNLAAVCIRKEKNIEFLYFLNEIDYLFYKIPLDKYNLIDLSKTKSDGQNTSIEKAILINL